MIDDMWRLGVDIGGVIIQPADNQFSAERHRPDKADADTSFFGDHFLRTPPVPGVFDGLATLVGEVFGEQVHLVSKCGERTERRTRQWLAHHDFHARTGVRPEHVRFCRRRPDKAPIAAELGLTHFVDDRLEVLSYLTTVPNRYLFRPHETEVQAHLAYLPAVRRVETWPELVAALAGGDGPA
jgi:hypothetical protein